MSPTRRANVSHQPKIIATTVQTAGASGACQLALAAGHGSNPCSGRPRSPQSAKPLTVRLSQAAYYRAVQGLASAPIHVPNARWCSHSRRTAARF